MISVLGLTSLVTLTSKLDWSVFSVLDDVLDVVLDDVLATVFDKFYVGLLKNSMHFSTAFVCFLLLPWSLMAD